MTSQNSSIASWLDAAGRRKPADKNETLRLIKAMNKAPEGSKARARYLNKACEVNLLLVANVVKSFAAKRLNVWGAGQVEDLLQQGYFGLRRAVEKFDPSRGYTFATYATPWIRQAISRYQNTMTAQVYVPENVSQQLFYIAKHGKMNKTSSSLTKNETLVNAARAALYPARLDAIVGDDGDCALHEVIAYQKPEPSYVKGDDTWASRLLAKKIVEAKLDELEAKLVRAYSLSGRLPTAARNCGMTEHKARPILRGAIKKLEALGPLT